MASLKEIRSRIASVNSTLKITSAMKMVASAKLHRVQSEAEALTEYETQLARMTSVLARAAGATSVSPLTEPHDTQKHVVIVALSSDGSLCGAFNANAIRMLDATVKRLRSEEGIDDITVYPLGEKIVQAAHKAGYRTCDDFRSLAGAPAYDRASELAQQLMDSYAAGRIDRVLLVHNHFHSMGQQKPCVETFLPLDVSGVETGTEGENADLYLFDLCAYAYFFRHINSSLSFVFRNYFKYFLFYYVEKNSHVPNTCQHSDTYLNGKCANL